MDFPVEGGEPPPPPPESKSTRKPKTDVVEGPSKSPPSKKAPSPGPKTESEEVGKSRSNDQNLSKDSNETTPEDIPKRGIGKASEKDVEGPKRKKKASLQEVTDDSDVEAEEPKAGPRQGGTSLLPLESQYPTSPRSVRERRLCTTDGVEVQPPKKKSATKKATVGHLRSRGGEMMKMRRKRKLNSRRREGWG
jgi:hypothetical protein